MFLIDKMIDKRIAAYQSELLTTHYAEVENMYRRMRGWRHDYRNHIQVLKSYADMGALDDIRRYLDALDTGEIKGDRGDGGRACGGGAHDGGDRPVHHHRKPL